MAARGDSSSTDKGSPPDEERIFDFFGLPRELREGIYGYLTIETQVKNAMSNGKARETWISLQNSPISKLLLICRQFKLEYEQYVKPTTRLLLMDTGRAENDTTLNACLNWISKVDIRLMAYPVFGFHNRHWREHITSDLAGHHEWISLILNSLTALKETRIQVYINWYRVGRPDWSQQGEDRHIFKSLELLTGLDTLRQLDVYLFSWTTDDDYDWRRLNAYDNERRNIATWTKTDGWVEY